MSRLRAAVLPLVVLLGTVGLVVLGKRVLFDHDGGYVVKAEFADSAGLRKNSAVKVGGVPGGRVTDLEVTERDTALVTMRLDPEAAPVGAGATAQSRPVNLLGEKYVDLGAGDAKRALPSGTTIPLRETGSAVELDDVLNVLDPQVRARVRILINEAGVALAGRGADFNGLLQSFPPALDELHRTIADLGADTAQMRRLIVQGRRVMGAVDERRDDLGRLVDGAAGALDAAASRRTELGRAVEQAPAALSQLRSTVDGLGDAAQDLAPAAASLRASAPALTDVLRRLPAFAADASGTLTTARDTAPALTRLGRRGAAPVSRLRPLADRLATFAADLAPVTKTLDGSMADALGFVHGFARAMQQRDGLGHLLRLHEVVNADSLKVLVDRYVKGPARRRAPKRETARRAPERPATPQRPAAKPAPAPVLPKVSELPKRLEEGVKDTVVRTTQGVDRLLELLLGSGR
ncbi:MlaD family protein [Conexibacter sp. SYSU D00693]|uniref:MlaD family protein n=1 Tax=Conexibacter sp. SYSU D00693 TaxID=2812560 RepID=UPI00196A7670|nr:MlaD family protein [Conexibacter sp. SYSU D00693]